MNNTFNNRLEYGGTQTATFPGICVKSGILLLITLIGTLIGKVMLNYIIANESSAIMMMILLFASPIITLILTLVITFAPNSARVLAVPYALLEGLSIGTIAYLLELAYGSAGANLVVLAFVITIGLFALALVLYSTGVIKVTNRLRSFALISILGIIAFAIIGAILNLITGGAVYALLFAFESAFPFIGILLSVVMIGFAGIYSIISFDNARRIVDNGLNKNFEWYASFGIILNLIYMYWQVLRLLIRILQSRK